MRTLTPVLCTSGLAAEAKVARAAGFQVIVGAGDPLRTAELVELAARRAKFLISFGVAGGLAPHLQSGQVILSAEVIGDDRRWHPNQRFHRQVGELARRTGLATSALRYYERAGLISPAGRVGGRRYYHVSATERVALIQLCQDAGFTLREIRTLVATRGRRGGPWTRLVEAKLHELDTRIAQTQRARTLVQHALACPHHNIFACANFRAALEAHLRAPNSSRLGA